MNMPVVNEQRQISNRFRSKRKRNFLDWNEAMSKIMFELYLGFAETIQWFLKKKKKLNEKRTLKNKVWVFG